MKENIYPDARNLKKRETAFIKTVVLLFFLLLPALFTGPAAAAGELNRTQIHDLFSEAKSLFHRADKAAATEPETAKALYREAAMRLERIISAGGIKNGKLYYNLGNTYFRMEDLGRAILNYRRAERYMPNDPNLKQNLTYARSQQADRIEKSEKTRMFQTLLFWHYDFSSATRSVIFAVCYVLFWSGLLIRRFFRNIPAGLIAGAAVVGILCFSSLAVDFLQQKSHPAGVILADEVTARKGGGETYQPSFKEPLHEGTEFRQLEKRSGWYRVRLNDGRQCWIPGNTAGLV